MAASGLEAPSAVGAGTRCPQVGIQAVQRPIAALYFLRLTINVYGSTIAYSRLSGVDVPELLMEVI